MPLSWPVVIARIQTESCMEGREMTELITLPMDELESLRQRVRDLERDYARFQAMRELMIRVTAATSLENVVETFLRLVVETFGGRASLYYMVGADLWVTDDQGGRRCLEEADDPLVREMLTTGRLLSRDGAVAPGVIAASEFQDTSLLVQPLMAGSDLTAVLRLEGMRGGAGETLATWSPFFTYTAQIIRNEITGYRGLRDVCDELRAANEELIHEVVERRRVEESLQLTQFAVDRALEIIFWVDASGRLFYVNERAVLLLGYSRQELLEKTVGAVAPAFPNDTWSLHWRRIRKLGALTLETKFWTRDGSEFPVEVAVNSLKLGDNEYAIISARDISRRKQIERQLAISYEQAKSELRAAAEMQKLLLPDPAAVCGVRFSWRYIPCRYVAGDIFNYFRLDESHIAFYLIDVAGHGVPAAMLSFTLSTILTPRNGLLRRLIPHPPGYEIVPPVEAVEELNRQFQSGLDVASYFAMTYGLINIKDDTLSIVQAGTPNPLLVVGKSEVRTVGNGGPPVGLLDGLTFEEVRIPFGPGDRLILCSDGVTECASPNGDFFPQDLLNHLLVEGVDRSLDGLLEQLEDELRRWRRRDDFDDDITILGIERK